MGLMFKEKVSKEDYGYLSRLYKYETCEFCLHSIPIYFLTPQTCLFNLYTCK